MKKTLLALLWLSLVSIDVARTQPLPPYDFHSGPYYDGLAQRFRPYLKFSKDGGRSEALRLSTWEFIYARSELRQPPSTGDDARIVETRERIAANPRVVLDHADVRRSNRMDLGLIRCRACDRNEYNGGEPWETAAETGAGIYAHIRPIAGTRLINIEYWLVFPFNDPQIAGGAGNHDVDFVTVTVVYDPDSDGLIRLTYSIHGRVLIAFDLTKAEPAIPVAFGEAGIPSRGIPVPGKPETFHHNAAGNVPVHKFVIKPFGTFVKTSLDFYAPDLEKVVYMLPDPVTRAPEHPVLFLEHGSHEAWPNPSGFFSAVPNHNGDDVSFLPKRVRVLRSPDDEPFVFYSGRFGTNDNVSLMAHHAWLDSLWVEPPERADKDANPYVRHDGVHWDAFGVHLVYSTNTWPPEEAPKVSGCYWTLDASEEDDRQLQVCAPSYWATAMGCVE